MGNEKYIAVFCSANNVAPKYVQPAEEFMSLMTKHGYNLVWGASDKGLMHVIANKIKEGGGKLIGVTIEFFKDVARKDADEIIMAKSLGERKTTMLNRGDAVIVLPGGIGTLDELMEILELKKQGEHHKPVVVLNTDHFYTGLRDQLQQMHGEGFITKPLIDLVFFADAPQQAMDYIEGHL